MSAKSCRIEDGLCMTHGFSVSDRVKCPGSKPKFHAHVQHPYGSGYMMQTGSFENVEQAVQQYLELVDADSNPYGRNALKNHPEPIQVLLIPAHLHGPDAMAYTGFCNVWNEDATDTFEVPEPDYVSVKNPRYVGGVHD